jgi:hypothetical protein
MCSLRTVVGPHVAVSSIEPLQVAMEMQEWVPLKLLLSCKIFHTAINNMNVLRSSCKVHDNVWC